MPSFELPHFQSSTRLAIVFGQFILWIFFLHKIRTLHCTVGTLITSLANPLLNFVNIPMDKFLHIFYAGNLGTKHSLC